MLSRAMVWGAIAKDYIHNVLEPLPIPYLQQLENLNHALKMNET